MPKVPPELQRQPWQDIDPLEMNRNISFIPSVERIGMESGFQSGRLESKQ
jgi:hypothetical protein